MEKKFKVAGMKVIRRAQGESVTQYTQDSRFENLDEANEMAEFYRHQGFENARVVERVGNGPWSDVK